MTGDWGLTRFLCRVAHPHHHSSGRNGTVASWPVELGVRQNQRPSGRLPHERSIGHSWSTPSHLNLAAEEDRQHPAMVKKALGIVKELTTRKRKRLFRYADYIKIMSRGTELPGR